jgi:hypothetical protein
VANIAARVRRILDDLAGRRLAWPARLLISAVLFIGLLSGARLIHELGRRR